MKKTKIKSNFTGLSDPALDARASGIISAMTGNPHFPQPTPALEDVSNSLKLFSEALALSKTGDQVKAAYKNQLRDNLDDLLTKLANYCSFIAQGDRFKLTSSGFQVNAEANSSKAVGFPENFSVEIGQQSGSAFASVNRVANANSYLFRWGVAPIANDNWFNTVSSQSRLAITGLVRGTNYSFQIGAAGSKGQLVFTDIITKMVV